MIAWFNRLPRAAIIGIVISIFLLGIAATIVLAATGQITPVQHTAIGIAPSTTAPPTATAPTYTFALYNADGATSLVSPIQWGNVTIGTPRTMNIIVENTGTATISIVVTPDASQPIPSGWTFTASPVTDLASGASASMTLTLSTTIEGPAAFTTDFTATY